MNYYIYRIWQTYIYGTSLDIYVTTEDFNLLFPAEWLEFFTEYKLA